MSKTFSLEDLLIRSIRAKRQFKALVRKVIANLSWLSVVEDEDLTENVRKNVQLIKTRQTKKSSLSVREKGILCKAAEYRTREEKSYLYRILGGLKCFRKYPDNVKMQLAAVTYFAYFPAGRVIVKQNHEAQAMYFILNGEVSVSVTILDPVIKETVTTTIGSMTAGSMFGEVALLHNITRTVTITTATPCEFVYLKKADFNIVLKASVAEERATIQRALSGFTYFQHWDEVAVRECCIYSHIKLFDRDQTILGDGLGVSTSCYFILRGKCRVVEHLLLDVTYDNRGKKHYKLHEDVPDAKAVSEEKLFLDEQKGSLYGLTTVAGSESSHSLPTNIQSRKIKPLQRKLPRKKKFKEQQPINPNKLHRSESKSNTTKVLTYNTKQPSKTATSKFTFQDEPIQFMSSKRSIDTHANRETHFMQVCILTEKACFGLGENLNNRRVVAMTDKVECLIIPRYWLLHKTKGNIWSRITQYLNKQIPSTLQVYEEFLAHRKWLSYRTKLIAELTTKPPTNAYYNIPYSIRINEDIRFNDNM